MSFVCNVCNKKFTRKQSLDRHLSNNKVHDKFQENIKTYDCECGKIYKFKQSLNKHKTICDKVTNKEADRNISELYEKRLQEQKVEFDKEREEFRNQIAMLLDKYAGNNTTNNTQHIETQNNNIHININAFGKENLDYIDDEAIIGCITRIYKSIPILLEKIHFDPNHPENHNIKITNKKLPYASVMGNNRKWKTVDRKNAIETMVNNGYNILDEKYTENKDKLPARKQQNFEGFQNKFDSDDKELMKQLKTDVDMLILNKGNN
jgi:hypothetical protein